MAFHLNAENNADSRRSLQQPSNTMNQVSAASARRISNYTVKPDRVLEQSQEPFFLSPLDLQFLTLDYIQTGLLFRKPQYFDTQSELQQLKNSLSHILTDFYPLSGRFVTVKTKNPPSYSVFLNCKDAPGVEFIYATSSSTMSDILSTVYVPSIIESFFPLSRPINHDAHTLPVLAVQVTELVDAIFIGCSFNHAVADGSSFWHFFNSWSEVSRSAKKNLEPLSRSPITKRWQDFPIVNLPYSDSKDFIEKYIPEPYRERIFHFSSQSIAKLKAKANADLGNTISVTSFQALSALVWRSVTRARKVSNGQKTDLSLPIDIRSRLEPPLPKEYFGNCIIAPFITITAGELLGNDLGWTARLLHKEISNYTNADMLSSYVLQMSTVILLRPSQLHDPMRTVAFGSSPRFDVYGNDFGWGKPVAVRSGFGLKCDGKVTWYPGREGGGSMDLEICLNPETMSALEMDDEFMAAVSLCTDLA